MHNPRRPIDQRLEDKSQNQRPGFERKGPDIDYGKVRLKLVEVARAKGLMHRGKPNRARIQALTHVADDTLYYLLRHPELTERIHFRTLAKLIYGLGVSLTDLLEYTPPGGGATPLSDQFKTDPTAGLGG